ncbi:hypothetical protein VZT92_020226 [Zoarces viviparus]|uniref:RING-type E3 ubiquitin transferase n=1 Tax=Zoarces viviparus TaxID=48416 RepID=A0AAW1EDS6_ZOAVI
MRKKMAAPVSDVKVSDREERSRRGALSLDDCRCPVCLEIFMEPVTLPCTHTFCKVCFLESVDKATLCCPLCRKRVSTWARLNSRKNTLVDQQLWDQIQTCFPLQCQRRLNGQDATEEDPGVSVCFPRVSQPGELKQEYEDQVTKLTEEKRVLDEEERRASEEFIQSLLAEEEELLQEETRRRQDDERLARLISSQLNSASVSQDSVGPADITPAKKKKKEVSGGQMEKFLCPLPSNSSSKDCSFMANKENILVSQVERPPPRLDYYGSDPPSASVEVHFHPWTHGSHMTGDGSSKRKSSELEESAPPGADLLGIAELEAELLSRQRQEGEDRRLALLLQKELDQEEKQRATDRRRGSSDPYPLRQPTRTSSKTCTPSSSGNPPTRLSTKTPTSSYSSRKQATLTEMFSGSPSVSR